MSPLILITVITLLLLMYKSPSFITLVFVVCLFMIGVFFYD